MDMSEEKIDGGFIPHNHIARHLRKMPSDKKPVSQRCSSPAGDPSRWLPPRRTVATATTADLLAREHKDAAVRGVTSIDDMREAIKRVACDAPAMTEVARMGWRDGAGFRAQAAYGVPFVLTGLVGRWPLSALTALTLRERFRDMPVRARVGDYVDTAFAPDRAMQDMSLLAYLDLIAVEAPGLPPYLGNLEMRALNGLCHWPRFFDKMGPARFWLGPAGTVTPLHCDHDDNIFAQIWGSKRIVLAPPHHHAFLYASAASAMLFGSPFDPEAPDFERFPLARQASFIECVVAPGELLYLPAGWYHQVRSLTFSLSANRWARGLPLALRGDPSLLRPS